MSQKYFCFPSIAATADDGTAVNKAGYLKIGGTNTLAITPAALQNFQIPLLGIKNGVYKAYTAETARVITITPTAANSTDYRVTLSAEKGQAYNSNLPNEIQTVFTHTTPTSGGTATTIGDAFRSAINNHPYWSNRVTVTGTTTIIITAKAGFPIFSAGVGANLALVVTTAGNVELGGKGADLLATGYFNDTVGKPVSGTNYGVFIFEAFSTSESVMSGHGDAEKNYIYIPSGGSGFNAALITALTTLLVK
jgi:hypothetical protein